MPFSRRVPLIFLAASFALVYGRFLIGHAPAGHDLVHHYLPYQKLVNDSLGSGEWPLWNPMTFCGRPLMADPQVGFFYPPNLLHRILPLPISFTLLFLAHVAWTLLGCWKLGRAWGLRPATSCLLAILFTFSGFLTFKLMPGMVLFHYAASWLPWSALAALALFRSPNITRSAWLSLCLAMSLLAGAPQIAFYIWFLVGFIALASSLFTRESFPRLRAIRTSGILGAFLLAILLTAIQTYPAWEMSQHSFDRGAAVSHEQRWEFMTEGSLHPRLLWLMILPSWFGPGYDDMQYRGTDTGFAEACAFLPLFTWALLIPIGFGLFLRRKRDADRTKRALFFSSLALIVFSLFMATGKYSPLYKLFFDYVPGFDFFRVPARLLFVTTVGLCLASAIGFDLLLEELDERYAARHPAWDWALPSLAVLNLAWMAWPYQKSERIADFESKIYPETALVKELKKQHRGGRILWMDSLLDWRTDQNTPEVTTNALIMQGLPDARGYDPMNARWIGTWFNRLAGLPPDMNPRGSMFVPRIVYPSWLTLMGVETVLSYEDLTHLAGLKLAGMIQFPEGPLGIWRNENFKGLAFPVSMRGWKSDFTSIEREEAQAAFESNTRKWTQPELPPFTTDGSLDASGPALSSNWDPMKAIDSSFEVTAERKAGNTFGYRVRYPQPGLLAFSQSAYPGWSVMIDGKVNPISVACGTFWAIAIERGEHVVEFRYQPSKGFKIAMGVSLAGLLGLLSFLGIGLFSQSRNSITRP